MPRLYMVWLRQPRDLNDKRLDPYWEGGSFGSTACHSRNLLHPRNSQVEEQDRLAFMQNFRGEIRVVGLTPPICEIQAIHAGRTLEVRWDARYRPFRYETAPILINNRGQSDFAQFAAAISLGGRTTPVGAVSSQFRSRARHLPDDLAKEVLYVCDHWTGDRAAHYVEAVRPSDDLWHAQALQQAWAEQAARAKEYGERRAHRK